MMTQFPLKLALNWQPVFANFLAGKNQAAVSATEHFLRESSPAFLYLWGAKDSGKSHLLMALCQQHADDSFYLPLDHAESLSPEILRDLESFKLVCIDNIDLISGNAAWEEALFHLYNRIRECNGYLIVSASSAPRALRIQLQDLQSRLMWGSCYQLQPLDDVDKETLLIQLANERGMQLSHESANYLIKRCPRETGYLVSLIDDLDNYSLARQHKLTIPLLRDWMQLQQSKIKV